MEPSEREAQRREEYRKRIQEFRLLDDEFMTVVFGDNIEATQLVLNIILQRTDITVTEVVGQREIKNVDGRSVRLDIHAVDQAGKHYDIEIQRAERGAVAQRARFNSSMMDTMLLKPGQDYAELPETYVIFITESDVLGAGRPLYHIECRIEEMDKPFGDGSHIIYVNGAYQDENDAVGRLMRDFHCKDAADMHYDVLAKRVRYFKQSEGGQEDMSQIIEEIRSEAIHDNQVDIAVRMLQLGKETHEEIADLTGLPLSEVEALAGRESA